MINTATAADTSIILGIDIGNIIYRRKLSYKL
jgi:hypothetical protein